MGDSAAGSQEADESARAQAQRDALSELIAIATHDINNPLQSLVVLLELSIDDALPGSDAQARLQQCLVAADRIRVLSSALGGLVRARPLDGPGAWTRVHGLLVRRFDRFAITVAPDFSALAKLPFPGELEFSLLCACLVVIATASHDSVPRRLEVVGVSPAGVELVLSEMPSAGWDPVAHGRLLALADANLDIRTTPGTISLLARGGG